MNKIKEKNNKSDFIALISDTHGYLSDSARQAMKGVSMILHAGDINTQKIFQELQEIAPLQAVRGNTDEGNWASHLPNNELVQIQNTNIYILHDLDDLDIKPEVADIQLVIYGHSHRPKISKQNGILYINPGSASSPRHGGPPSLVLIKLNKNNIDTKIINLNSL